MSRTYPAGSRGTPGSSVGRREEQLFPSHPGTIARGSRKGWWVRR